MVEIQKCPTHLIITIWYRTGSRIRLPQILASARKNHGSASLHKWIRHSCRVRQRSVIVRTDPQLSADQPLKMENPGLPTNLFVVERPPLQTGLGLDLQNAKLRSLIASEQVQRPH